MLKTLCSDTQYRTLSPQISPYIALGFPVQAPEEVIQNMKQGTHLYIAGRMIKLFITTASTDSIGTQDLGLAYFYF